MAVNTSRSMNADLQQGTVDGLRKNLTPDRGGEVEEGAALTRAADLQPQYGITDNGRRINRVDYN